MAKFTLLSAMITAGLSIAIAPPALAQAANPEPGYCAQFYPNSDCNSIGPDTPGSNKAQREAVESEENVVAPVSPPVKPAKPRKQAHRSASSTAGVKPPKTDAVAK